MYEAQWQHSEERNTRESASRSLGLINIVSVKVECCWGDRSQMEPGVDALSCWRALDDGETEGEGGEG